MELKISVAEALAVASGEEKAVANLRRRIDKFAAQFSGKCKLCGKAFVSKRRGRKQYCSETCRVSSSILRKYGAARRVGQS